jgi:hypothetical protein
MNARVLRATVDWMDRALTFRRPGWAYLAIASLATWLAACDSEETGAGDMSPSSTGSSASSGTGGGGVGAASSATGAGGIGAGASGAGGNAGAGGTGIGGAGDVGGGGGAGGGGGGGGVGGGGGAGGGPGPDQWAKLFYPTNNAYLGYDGVVVDPISGDIAVAGFVRGDVDFGGGNLGSVNDTYAARFTAQGDHVWSRRVGAGFNWREFDGLAMDAASNIAVAVRYTGTFELEGTVLANTNGIGDFKPNVALVRLAPDGSVDWFNACGEPGFGTSVSGLAATASGDLLVSTCGSCDLGDGAVVGPALQKLDASGGHLWSVDGLASCGSTATSKALDDAWRLSGDLTRYDGAGVPLWTAPAAAAYKLAVDSAGNALITGFFTGTIDLGGGPLTSAGEDIFLAKFSPSGTHLWSFAFGDAFINQRPEAIAVDAAGNVAIVGHHDGTVDFGGGPTAPGGFVAKFDAAGQHLTSRWIGDFAHPHGVAFDAAGHMVVVGKASSPVDFGWGPITPANSMSPIFLAKMD